MDTPGATPKTTATPALSKYELLEDGQSIDNYNNMGGGDYTCETYTRLTKEDYSSTSSKRGGGSNVGTCPRCGEAMSEYEKSTISDGGKYDRTTTTTKSLCANSQCRLRLTDTSSYDSYYQGC
jgi:hypothetical protein